MRKRVDSQVCKQILNFPSENSVPPLIPASPLNERCEVESCIWTTLKPVHGSDVIRTQRRVRWDRFGIAPWHMPETRANLIRNLSQSPI